MISKLSAILRGTISGQAVAFLALPILATIFQPGAYGEFAVILSATTVMSIMCTLQLQSAIVITKSNSHARVLFVAAYTGAWIGGAVTVVLVPLLVSIALPNTESNIYLLSLLSGLTVSASAIHQIYLSLAVKRSFYGSVGQASLIRSLVMVTVQIALGMIEASATILMVGVFLGELAAVLFLNKQPFMQKISLCDLRRRRSIIITKRYVDFIAYGTTQEVLLALSNGVVLILLSFAYSSAVAGHYAFALKVVMSPIGIIASALRQVLSVKISDIQNDHILLRQYVKRSTNSLFQASVIFIIVTLPFIEAIFLIVFSTNWKLAASFSPIILVACAFSIFNVPSTISVKIIREQKIGLIINLLSLLLKLLAVSTFSLLLRASPAMAVVILMFITCLTNITIIYFVIYKLKILAQCQLNLTPHKQEVNT